MLKTRGLLALLTGSAQVSHRCGCDGLTVQIATNRPARTVQRVVAETVDEAIGREARDNPVLPRTGGPAGNTLLTAWTAVVLLVLAAAELLTLFDVRGLISWHVALGALLVPPALMKTASTGWRMTRYYLGSTPYREAGPPPLLLRLLAPVVVASTLGLLGTGILLVLIGEERAHQALVTILGLSIDWVTLHQAFFAVWAVATGLHLLGRIFPALQQTVLQRSARTVPGSRSRMLWFALMLTSATVLAVVLVLADTSWTALHGFEQGSALAPGNH